MTKKPDSVSSSGNLLRRASQNLSRPALQWEQLEPRILYSAAPVSEAPGPEEEETPAAADVIVDVSAAPSDPAVDAQIPVPAIELAAGGGDAADEAAWDLSLDEGEAILLANEGEPLGMETVEAFAEAAARRWAESGLSEAQLAALGQVTYHLQDLGGGYLGAAEGTHVFIDDNGGGVGWFVDATPDDDVEFGLGADDAAARQGIDLLSVLMHEQGHILGLLDASGAGMGSSVMFGIFEAGERRTPVAGQAEGATPGSLEGVHYALTQGDGPLTWTATSIGGDLWINDGTDTVAFNGVGGDITMDNGGVDIVALRVEFATDAYDLETASGEKLIIADGGVLSMLEDGNNDHTDINADIELAGNAFFINEDDNDILRFWGDVNVGTGTLTISGGNAGSGIHRLLDDTPFATGGSNEDVRFEASGSITGQAGSTIRLMDDVFVRLNADNSATFAGDWFIDSATGNPTLYVNVDGGLGTGKVTLDQTNATLRISEGVTVDNLVEFTNGGANKFLIWDGLTSQQHTGDVTSAETTSNAARLQVQQATNVVTFSGQLSGAGWIDKVGAGTLILTTADNSGLTGFRVDQGTAILADSSAQAGQTMVGGNATYYLGDGVVFDSLMRLAGGGVKVLGLAPGAVSATIDSVVRFETDFHVDGRGTRFMRGLGAP